MNKTISPSTEDGRQKHAFEFYYGLGWKRRYAPVAQELGVSVSTIKNWSRAFDWRQRVDDRDAEATRRLADRVGQQIEETQDRLLKYIAIAMNKVVKDIIESKAKTSPKDLTKLIDTRDRLLNRSQGEADSDGRPAPGRVVIYIPDNGRDKLSRPLVPDPFRIEDSTAGEDSDEKENKPGDDQINCARGSDASLSKGSFQR